MFKKIFVLILKCLLITFCTVLTIGVLATLTEALSNLLTNNTPTNREKLLETIVSNFFLIFLPCWFIYKFFQKHTRIKYIKTTIFPNNLWIEFQKKFPDLTHSNYLLAEEALRDFFKIRLYATGKTPIGMPSKIVDELWHAFILDTIAYEHFCQQAFGKYFHHIPASSMSSTVSQEEGLQIAWMHLCQFNRLNAIDPEPMPLLFSIDQQLIPETGNVYYPSQAALDAAIQEGKPVGGYACANGLAEYYIRSARSSNDGSGGGGCGGGGG